jgi:hypothetical protein
MGTSLCEFRYTFGRRTCRHASHLKSKEFTRVAIASWHASQLSMHAPLHRACSMQALSAARRPSSSAYVHINGYVHAPSCALRPHHTHGRILAHDALDRFTSASRSHVKVSYETTHAAAYATYQKTIFCEVGVERHHHGHERPSAHEPARWLRNSTG